MNLSTVLAAAFGSIVTIGLFSLDMISTPEPEPNKAAVQKVLQGLSPDIIVESIRAAPIKGLNEVTINDGEILLIDRDLKYVFHGVLFEITDGQAINLTEKVKSTDRVHELMAINEEDLIVYSAKDKKGSVTIFTDTDCPYCQKMHEEIAELNELGIEVRYAAFPRMGVDSDTYRRMSAAWCAPDRKEAITHLFEKKPVESASCEHPVSDQFELGRRIGVQGTPAIFTSSGRLIGGLLPAKAIAEIVSKEDANKEP